MKYFTKIMLAFKSKNLIKNWYSSLFDYLILKKSSITIKCLDGSIVNVDREVYSQILTYFYWGNISDCINNVLIFKLKDHKYHVPIYEINNASGGIQTVLKALEHEWKYKENYWEKDNVKFKHMHAEIIATFEDKEYGFIDVKNKVVTDIGAFIGDTSIYFAIKGANSIYAIEPHPGAYKELVENIRLNNLESKIIPLNVGIGYKANYITVNVNTKQAPQIYLRNSQDKGAKVVVSTLSDIIKNYNINTDVLKMDCEGCEYDIILNDYTTVSKFEQIVFEYHAYNTNISINNLMNILNQSHNCEFVNQDIYRKNDPTWNRDKIGMIYCVKKK